MQVQNSLWKQVWEKISFNRNLSLNYKLKTTRHIHRENLGSTLVKKRNLLPLFEIWKITCGVSMTKNMPCNKLLLLNDNYDYNR